VFSFGRDIPPLPNQPVRDHWIVSERVRVSHVAGVLTWFDAISAYTKLPTKSILIHPRNTHKNILSREYREGGVSMISSLIFFFEERVLVVNGDIL
jgi:hypothetical protein